MKIDNKRYDYKQVIRVDSPAPLSDGMKGSQWIYVLLIVVSLLIGFFSSGMFGLSIFTFGFILYYVTRTLIADHGLTQIRKKIRFYMPPVQFTQQELLAKITAPLTSMGMIVDVTKDGLLSITHNKQIYDITFKDDNTYGIWWRLSVGRAFLGFNGEISRYRKAVVSIGIIAYTIQQALEEIAQSKNIYNQYN